jgi:hypothetical protein
MFKRNPKLSAIFGSVSMAVVALALVFTFLTGQSAQAKNDNVLLYPGVVRVVSNASVAAVTSTTAYAGINWLNYTTADVYVTTSGPSASLTTTYVIQDSPDYTNWFTRTWVVTATAAGTSYVRVNATGAYFRIQQTDTDATAITSTIKVVLK